MRKLDSLVRAHRRFLVPLLTAGSALFVLSACSDDPVEAPAGVGKTYLLTIPDTNWVPDEVGAEVGAYVPQFLLNVQSVEGGNIKFLMGTANDGVQEVCNPTSEVNAAGDSLDAFVAGPTQFPLYILNEGMPGDVPVDVQANIYNFKLTNVLPDGSGVPNGSVEVTMDIREIYSLFTRIPTVDPDKVCNALMQLNSQCTPCPDGTNYCLSLSASNLEATETQTVVNPVAAASLPATCPPIL